MDEKNCRYKSLIVVLILLFSASVSATETAGSLSSFALATELANNGKVIKAEIREVSEAPRDPNGSLELQSYSIEDYLKDGFPEYYINKELQTGMEWRVGHTILYNGREVSLTTSFSVKKIDKFLGDDVAIIEVLYSGVEAPDTRSKEEKWIGMGHEIWSIDGTIPYLRVGELNRGEMKISCSKVITNW